MKLHETLLGLLLVALAVVVFGHTFTFPAFPGQRWGPALFPRVLCAGLAVCGLLLVARGRRSGQPWVQWDDALREPRRAMSFLAMPLAVGLYLLLAERLGFLPTAALLVAGLAHWFGVRLVRAIVLGVVTSAVVHWFFASIMRVPLPRGWFMQVLAGG